MTSKEKEILKTRFQQCWAEAITKQEWAKTEKHGWTRERAIEEAAVARGYMYAIGDALEASMKQSKSNEIVRSWADEVEENKGVALELQERRVSHE